MVSNKVSDSDCWTSSGTIVHSPATLIWDLLSTIVSKAYGCMTALDIKSCTSDQFRGVHCVDEEEGYML